MDVLFEADQRVIALLARRVRAWQQRAGLNLHPVLFFGAVALYVVLWAVLCRLERQPELLWYLVGAGFGTVGAWLADNEPIAELEPGIALTHFGLDKRWALTRLVYLPLALFLIVPMLLGGKYSAVFVALALVEVVLFGMMEYLLTFRLMGEGERVVLGMVLTEGEPEPVSRTDAEASPETEPPPASPEPDTPS